MASQPRPFLIPQQDLEIDRAAERGSEYCAGEMFPMTAVSLTHDRLFRNALRSLEAQLRGQSCEPAGDSLRVGSGPEGPTSTRTSWSSVARLYLKTATRTP